MPAQVPTRGGKWPLAVKLAAAVVILALVPLLAVVLFDVRDVEVRAAERERDALRRQATDAALRIGERVERLRAFVEVLAANPSLRAASAAASGVRDAEAAREWDAEHEEIWPLLSSLKASNAWFEHVYLLNERGVCIATSERETKPDMFGRDYSYRPYFRAPTQSGAAFVSDVLKNATSEGTAIFVSAPVVVDGTTHAVAVIKVRSDALHDVVGELSQLGRRALFIDRFGVVVSEAHDEQVSVAADEDSLHFHPLAPVDAPTLQRFEETRRYGDPQGENYLDRIEQPIGLDELWHAMGPHSGSGEYDVPPYYRSAPQRTVLGWGAVWSGEDEPYGYLALGEPSAQFREPLQEIGAAALYRFFVVLVIVVVLMAFAIHRLAGDSEADVTAAREEAEQALKAAKVEVGAKRALVGRIAEVDRANRGLTLEATARILGADVEPGLEVTAFELEGLLQQLAAAAKASATLGGTKLEVDAAGVGEIETDRARLSLLLGNLLENAVDNTRNGTIVLTATRTEGKLVCTVKDSGMGLSPRQLRAFEGPIGIRFDGERVGLGVPVARQLAQDLRGRLAARTSNRGTTITLELPV